MISEIVIFGRSVPLYGIFFFIGIGAAVLAAILICRKIKFDKWEIVYSAIYTMIGAILGAKLLFIAVSLKEIIEYDIPIINVIKGGFVFYGGLIGGFSGLFIYCKQYKLKQIEYLEIYSTVLPLGHAFGRVGCFFGGCCYGIPCDFGVVYTKTVGMTPLGVRLLPIQLIEAALLLVLFAVQLLIMKRKKESFTNTAFYCIAYPCIRFILEFFRGDAERGSFLSISTSQWVSLAVVAASMGSLLIFGKKATKE